jgi:hypothetical protein
MAYLRGVNRGATSLFRRLETGGVVDYCRFAWHERLLAGLSMGGYANRPLPVQGEASLDR